MLSCLSIQGSNFIKFPPFIEGADVKSLASYNIYSSQFGLMLPLLASLCYNFYDPSQALSEGYITVCLSLVNQNRFFI